MHLRRRSIAVATAWLLLAGSTVAAAPRGAVDTVVTRLAGADRSETAARVSADATPRVARRVYLVSDRALLEAVPAAIAAMHQRAPVLLTGRAQLPRATARELRRLAPRAVVVVGGQRSVADSVLRRAARVSDSRVVRTDGTGAVATAAAISRGAFARRPAVAYVASGGTIGRSAPAVALLGAGDGPLLLTGRRGLPAATDRALRRLRPRRIELLGARGSVAGSVVRHLGRLAPTRRVGVGSPVRLALQRTAGLTPASAAAGAYLAAADAPWSAVIATVAAARSGAPLLLVSRDTVPAAAARELSRLSPRRLIVVGSAREVTARNAEAARRAAQPPVPPRPFEPGIGVPRPLVFTAQPLSGCSRECHTETRIWTAELDGSGAAPVTDPQEAFDRNAVWSLRGDALAFTRIDPLTGRGELWVVAALGDRFAAAQRVTDTQSLNGGQGCDGEAMAPAWSPDGRRLAATCADGPRGSVVVASADGSVQWGTGDGLDVVDRWPAWHPGSGRLAFSRAAAGEMARLVSANVSADTTADVRVLLTGTASLRQPSFSPDGSRVAVVDSDDANLDGRIVVADADGRGASTLWHAPPLTALYDVAWSPDGSRLAVPVGDGLTTSVVSTVSLDDGRLVAISRAGMLAFDPAWAGENRVVFDVVESASGVEIQRLQLGGDLIDLAAPVHAYEPAVRP